jgi:hypothetical protein
MVKGDEISLFVDKMRLFVDKSHSNHCGQPLFCKRFQPPDGLLFYLVNGVYYFSKTKITKLNSDQKHAS